jgi:glucosamine--fructose-6-phosphate aminotransferase (isomerizing)
MNDMTLMERETRESPAVAMRLVDLCSAQLAEVGARLRTLEPRLILAAGRGSSDAAALLAKYVFETRLGLPTVSVAPSVHSIYGAKLTLEKALVLAISQSGRSPDLVEFCRAATGPDVLRIAMVNDAASPLTTAVDVTLPLMAGPETSVAATKSCRFKAMRLANCKYCIQYFFSSTSICSFEINFYTTSTSIASSTYQYMFYISKFSFYECVVF